MKQAGARVILRVAKILKKTRRTILSVRTAGGSPRIVAMNWGLNMGFLYSPVTWTLIILILSGLGIFRELL
jgi:hypothetical protein